MKHRIFSDPYIRSLKAEPKPYKRSEGAAKGEGRLMVRVLPEGIKEFFYRYRASGGDKLLALGRYDAKGRNGKTLEQVRKKLRDIRAKQRETGDVKGHLQAEAQRQEIEKRKGSFGQLLEAYTDSLKASGRVSSVQVVGALKVHVLEPFGTVADRKAAEIEAGDIQRILARMVKAGLTRQVNKVRSYLSAAFAFGLKADHDPRTVAKDGVLFGLKINPVIAVPRIGDYERTGERVLTDDELREFWKALDSLPVVQAAALRFNLALACQRPTQLLRADWPAFDFEQTTLLLRDSKGRGGSRDHLLPITDFALEQFKPLRQLNSDSAMPFSSDGKRALVVETLSAGVAGISRKLKREAKIPPFQMRDLRRTAETMLQRLGVDKEVRAHLLSHGRAQGVQGKHYERYTFLPEKRAALEKWARHLERIITGKSASVTAIRAA